MKEKKHPEARMFKNSMADDFTLPKLCSDVHFFSFNKYVSRFVAYLLFMKTHTISQFF